MDIRNTEDGFEIVLGDGACVLRHSVDAPAFTIGRGHPDIFMYRGNFKLTDDATERLALRHAYVDGDRITLAKRAGGAPLLTLTIKDQSLAITCHDDRFNRLWVILTAEEGERVWGGGEQMSYFNMRGRVFPLWTSEPGVGRDKSTELTRKADEMGHAGGDYWTTNYPQPTYISSRRYAFHVDTTAYTVFDFSQNASHGVEIWGMPTRLEFFKSGSFQGLVGQLAERFGKQPQLPDWAIEGAIVGLKDGDNSFARLEKFMITQARITGLWCEDWVGIRETSFGKRLFWDWKWNAERYPDLPKRIADLNARGIRFLGYVNPYLCNDGTLYKEALAKGYLALKPGTEDVYLVDFGEFDCGVVDFTNDAACAWFAERVIGREMLDFGLSGWMADFGEYLPTDVALHDGSDALLAHNFWPVLWAKVNADAIAARGKTGEAVFFMRAGWSGVQAHCPLLWGGDQSVDFSRHDGIGTVICAALSSGLMGNAYHHSDVGGYTSLFGNVRTAELIQRWSEMAAFTPVMRSHEGNRPTENLQLDSSDDILQHFAAFTRVHADLAPYTRALCEEAAATGLPLQRPLFLHYENDAVGYDLQDQYLYGGDLLVAPIIEEGQTERQVYLPGKTAWTHLWSGESFAPGWVTCPAPIGEPPVFYRPDSHFAPLFQALGKRHAEEWRGMKNG